MRDESNEYEPSASEYRAVGIFGIMLYALVIVVAIFSFAQGNSNRMTFYFFVCMTITCVLEQPRFIMMALTGSYTSVASYVSHIIATGTFFMSLSFVCYQWKGLLRLGKYSQIVYSSTGIIVTNIIFTCVEVVAIGYCATAPSLHSYFSSTSFEAFTLIETAKNAVYCGFLAYYGLKLAYHFAKFTSSGRVVSVDRDRVSIFGNAVRRLTVTLVLSTLCFILRMSMLSIKIIAFRYSGTVTSPSIPLFGLAWFFLADFIPRCLPSVAFILLMTYSKVRPEGTTTGNKSSQGRGLLKNGEFGSGFSTAEFDWEHDDYLDELLLGEDEGAVEATEEGDLADRLDAMSYPQDYSPVSARDNDSSADLGSSPRIYGTYFDYAKHPQLQLYEDETRSQSPLGSSAFSNSYKSSFPSGGVGR
jgi:hypothetical protein